MIELNDSDKIELFEQEIQDFHPSGLCPICDNAITEGEPSQIVLAHQTQYLCHLFCIEDLIEETYGYHEEESL